MKNKALPTPNFVYHSRPKAGLRRHTVVGIIEDDQFIIGHAAISDKDVFIKKLGIKIATGRAIQKPLKVITRLGRSDKELKVLFYDITTNFSTTYPKIVVPQYPPF